MALTWSRLRYTWHTFGVSRRQLKSSCGHEQKSIDGSKVINNCQKKDTLGELPRAYEPRFVEEGWYDWWESRGLFSPKSQSDEPAEKFVMCLPPPNVTGTLHLGHALGNSIQDALVRWHRMNGRDTLWHPGCDHAGIATQVVVERQLYKERRLRRQDLTREQFVKEVWKWKEQKGATIYDQMRRLGSALDWPRACFTLDPKLSRGVNEAFIRLHDEGLIYRSSRLVNWSCALKSAVSDIEVEGLDLTGKTYLEVPGYDEKVLFGFLADLKYPLENSDRTITVATTRPETMLGDVAIAIHPEDSRYTDLHGRYALHPLTGARLPIICDDTVNRELGTGAVKITPGHDHKDYEMGERHNLNTDNILSEDGCLTNVPPMFLGLPRFIARTKIMSVLSEKGLLGDVQDHPLVLPVCSRSKDIIEPMLKDQWYVDCQDMAKQAIKVVESRELQLIPDHYEKQWYDWLNNIRDWCISRQLWWGHRIPAYRIHPHHSQSSEEYWVSAHTEAEAIHKACQKYGLNREEFDLKQDEDVLDTWFSSALFPFTIFGWPDQTADLTQFYPTSLLETASDIIFFWVARMVMMGQKLTGKLPFRQVLLHSILRDSQGRKMSKSLGNIIDPLDVIEGVSLKFLQERLEGSNLSREEITRAKQGQRTEFPQGIPECGTDALRFSLCSLNYKAASANLDLTQIVNSRHFCNKIWQAFRLTTSSLGDDFIPATQVGGGSTTDVWMRSRLSAMLETCDQAFHKYDLREATGALYRFWQLDFCDIYLEYSKKALKEGLNPDVIRQNLYVCFNVGLRALAPFMPFLCEELFQRLPGEDRADSVFLAAYPLPSMYPWRDSVVEDQMSIVRSVIGELLSLRQDLGLTKSRATVYILCHNSQTRETLESHMTLLGVLSRSKEVVFVSEEDQISQGCVQTASDNCDLYIRLQGEVDVDSEKQRLTRQYSKLEKTLERLRKQADPDKGIPEHIVTAAVEKIGNSQRKMKRISDAIKVLEIVGRNTS